MMPTNPNNIVILNIIDADYRCFINGISKSRTVYLKYLTKIC